MLPIIVFGTEPLHNVVSLPEPDISDIRLFVTGLWTLITTILLTSVHFDELTILRYQVESVSEGGE